MQRSLMVFLITLLCYNCFSAVYTIPGTGVNWNLNELVTNSRGNVKLVSSEYYFSDGVTISVNNALQITSNEVAKFAAITVLRVHVVLIIDPPLNVLFAAADQSATFLGVRHETSNGSFINKLTMEYASSFRIANCNPQLNDCIFRYNNISSTTGNGTVSLFTASPV